MRELIRELAGKRKLALKVLSDTVTLEIKCGDEYEAQVFYDDLMDRLKAGESIQVSFEQDYGEKKKT